MLPVPLLTPSSRLKIQMLAPLWAPIYIFFKELCRHYIGQSPALSRDLSIISHCTVTICPEFCVDVDCKTKNNASILKNALYKKKKPFLLKKRGITQPVPNVYESSF